MDTGGENAIMHRKTIGITAVALALILGAFGVVAAQPVSPLVGVPHMAEEPGGSEMQKFPSGTETVYLVFDYETQGDVEIIAEIRSEEQQGSVIFTNRETYSGNGTANIEVEGPGPDGTFPDGVYDTIIRFGEERYVTAGWEWGVGEADLPEEDPSAGEAPVTSLEEREPPSQSSAASEGGAATNVESNPSSQEMASSAQSVPAPGFSPVILGVIATVVVVLLAIIAWAVRGFMTAEQ